MEQVEPGRYVVYRLRRGGHKDYLIVKNAYWPDVEREKPKWTTDRKWASLLTKGTAKQLIKQLGQKGLAVEKAA